MLTLSLSYLPQQARPLEPETSLLLELGQEAAEPQQGQEEEEEEEGQEEAAGTAEVPDASLFEDLVRGRDLSTISKVSGDLSASSSLLGATGAGLVKVDDTTDTTQVTSTVLITHRTKVCMYVGEGA